MSKFLITLGVALILLGLLYPYLASLGFGKLPGDIHIKKDNFSFYFPITSAIIISIIVSIFLRIIK